MTMIMVVVMTTMSIHADDPRHEADGPERVLGYGHRSPPPSGGPPCQCPCRCATQAEVQVGVVHGWVTWSSGNACLSACTNQDLDRKVNIGVQHRSTSPWKGLFEGAIGVGHRLPGRLGMPA
jgi:hypothetical protein